MGNFPIFLPVIDAPTYEQVESTAREFSWTLAVAWGLGILAVLAVLGAVGFVAMSLRDRWRGQRKLRRIPLDPLRHAAAYRILTSPVAWRGCEGRDLRARGRAALTRVFGPGFWRTLLTERAVRGLAVIGVSAEKLGAWVAVYLDSAVRKPRAGAPRGGGKHGQAPIAEGVEGWLEA
ncbi:MAG: hypothetical protein AB1938_30635 [Myxococcota bacterium]